MEILGAPFFNDMRQNRRYILNKHMNTGNYVHTLSIMYKISPSSKLISSGYKRTQDSIKITTNLRDHFLKLHYSKRLFTANFRKLSSIEIFLHDPYLLSCVIVQSSYDLNVTCKLNRKAT